VTQPTVEIPADVYARLVKVAMHVSRGRSAAFQGVYPDATARRALGALDDAGLLPSFCDHRPNHCWGCPGGCATCRCHDTQEQHP
jgi:hypothetical protein